MNIREDLNHQNLLLFFQFRNGVWLGKQSKGKEIRGETKALLRHEQTSSSADLRHVNVTSPPPPQCHHMSFVDFMVLPPGHGRSVTDF